MGGFGTEPSAQDAVPGSGSENVMTCQSLNRGGCRDLSVRISNVLTK